MLPKFYILWTISLCTLTLVASQDESKKPFFRQDYTLLEKFGGFYKFHIARQNFSDALLTCEAEGAELLYPSSAEEVTAIFKMINRENQDGLTIAAHNLYGTDRNFLTLSGIPIENLYHRWADGEPSNTGGSENCLAVRREGTFNDFPCFDTSNFVCRRSLQNLTQNMECETWDLNYEYNIDLNKCYKLHKNPMKWREAFKVCFLEGSQLVVINDQSEADYLVNELEKYPERNIRGNFDKTRIHVGFNDLINNGVYITTEGHLLSDSGYGKWAINQPNNVGGVEHCGAMFRDGTLDDIDCDKRIMFVCEKSFSDSGSEVTSAPVDPNLTFRPDYTLLVQFGAFYKYHRSFLGFPDAVATCSSEGATLMYPTSTEEAEAIFKFVKRPELDYLWVGAHDLYGESVFVTLTGAPVKDDKWGYNEPNNIQNNEHCAHIKQSTKLFNDYICDKKYSFVCKKEAKNITNNAACETYDPEYNFNIDLNKCYKLHKNAMSWRDAFRICRAEGAHLVIINSDKEADILVSELESYPESSIRGNIAKEFVHAGFNDLINRGIYITVEGFPVAETGYDKWSENHKGTEQCGAMKRDGSLTDVNCDVRALFFCEKTLTGTVVKPLNMPTTFGGSGLVLLPDARK